MLQRGSGVPSGVRSLIRVPRIQFLEAFLQLPGGSDEAHRVSDFLIQLPRLSIPECLGELAVLAPPVESNGLQFPQLLFRQPLQQRLQSAGLIGAFNLGCAVQFSSSAMLLAILQ